MNIPSILITQPDENTLTCRSELCGLLPFVTAAVTEDRLLLFPTLTTVDRISCGWVAKIIEKKNVLQFILISAHYPTQSNLVSRNNYYLPVHHGVCCSVPTHETATFFL